MNVPKLARRAAIVLALVTAVSGSTSGALAAATPPDGCFLGPGGGTNVSAAGFSPEIGRWHVRSDQSCAWFAGSVSTAGDVNGDGYDDVIVGGQNYDNGQTDEGIAVAFYGSPDGPSTIPDWFVESDRAFAYFGTSVSGAGDVNGDGYDDVIVGAEYYGLSGAVFAYLGSASGLSETPAWTVQGDQPGSFFGTAIAGAGDVNGDGFADVILGALGYDDQFQVEGEALLYEGSPAGLSATPAWIAKGTQVVEEFGTAVGSGGDVNGDGYDDVLIGAPGYDGAVTDAGLALIYFGSASGLSQTPGWTAEGQQSGDSFAGAVAGAGDVNGDGIDDVVIGAPFFTINNDGAAFAYLGSPTGPGQAPAWTGNGEGMSAHFGSAVALAGDMNGDGHDDLFVGSPGLSGGAAYIFPGSNSGLRQVAAQTFRVQVGASFPEFGQTVSFAGDTNGDGFDDVIVGAPRATLAEFEEGAAVTFFGGSQR